MRITYAQHAPDRWHATTSAGQTFTGSSLADVHAQVRAAMGEDALAAAVFSVNGTDGYDAEDMFAMTDPVLRTELERRSAPGRPATSLEDLRREIEGEGE